MDSAPKAETGNLTTIVARFRTKGDPKEFERFFLEHVEWMRRQDGFGAHQAVYLSQDPSTYVNFGWWVTREAFQKVTESPEFRAHQGVMHKMLENAEIEPCVNLFRVNAGEEAGKREEFAKPLMNVTTFEVDGDPAAFEKAFATYADTVRDRRGFGYADLNRSVRRPGRYIGIGYWWDPEAYEPATAQEEYQALVRLARTVTVERVEHVAWNRAADPEEAVK
ncbi:antibiotic biosynthesis monooxygenase [Micromonospora sp. B11E3]|uniref:antibiotic biosynthesis monooxygenase family protein n=1 Tax=Micromonospora sp. B11E3 TaxID=3153562 RepID=UPI00325DD801